MYFHTNISIPTLTVIIITKTHHGFINVDIYVFKKLILYKKKLF